MDVREYKNSKANFQQKTNVCINDSIKQDCPRPLARWEGVKYLEHKPYALVERRQSQKSKNPADGLFESRAESQCNVLENEHNV